MKTGGGRRERRPGGLLTGGDKRVSNRLVGTRSDLDLEGRRGAPSVDTNFCILHTRVPFK